LYFLITRVIRVDHNWALLQCSGIHC